MIFKTKIVPQGFFVCALFFTVFLLSTEEARAANSFFVDSSYDAYGRTQITATNRFEGNHAHYFVEDSYWNKLGLAAQNKLINDVSELSRAFDKDIYDKTTLMFGQEWKPGIDNDIKITILLADLKEEAGGYFQLKDEYPITLAKNSNEREIIYLNARHVGYPRAKAFIAHELQHLINFNQKTRLKGINEEVWLNELLSEITPTMIGLDDVYAGSNLEERVKSLNKEPGDALLDWGNKAKDYGSVNLFAQYLYDRYGKDIFTLISQSGATGIEAINFALDSLVRPERFSDIFYDWTVTLLVNDCAAPPSKKYCYTNPNLSNIGPFLTFSYATVQTSQQISFGEATANWAGNWFSWQSTALQNQRPEEHVFHLTFSSDIPSDFRLNYVIFKTDGSIGVFNAPVANGAGEILVNDFNYLVKEVVVIPVNGVQGAGTIGNAPKTRFFLNAKLERESLESSLPVDVTKSAGAIVVEIPDGALIRAEGRPEVYIVNGKYKRWVQTAEVFAMYGHLRWEDIITVSQAQLDSYTESLLIKLFRDPRVFVASKSGIKQWIRTEQEFLRAGYSWDMIYTVNEKEFNWFR